MIVLMVNLHVKPGRRDDFLAAKLPGFLPGVWLERRLDDGCFKFDRANTKHFPIMATCLVMDNVSWTVCQRFFRNRLFSDLLY